MTAAHRFRCRCWLPLPEAERGRGEGFWLQRRGNVPMTQRFESEELDGASLEYLRTAHRHKGEGMPGIYLDHKAGQLPSAWMPGCGAIVGAVLVVVTLFMTWGSLADPINTAMLQTAGLFLGVWLMVAWVRSRAARSR